MHLNKPVKILKLSVEREGQSGKNKDQSYIFLKFGEMNVNQNSVFKFSSELHRYNQVKKNNPQ